MAERDYVLGTHDDEIYRLGFQHRVWRPRALDAWARARIGDGCKVIDFGAGPGFATMDLAEMVGPSGQVHALERSRRFLDTLEAQAKARGFAQVKAHEIDVVSDPIPVANADAAWARWIFAFLPNPKAALKKLVDAVKPGGALVFHEYLDYETWKLAPPAPNFEKFVDEVAQNWRGSGGEPDIARHLPSWLTEMGLKVAQRYSGLTRQVVVTNSDVVADRVVKARMQATKVTTFVTGLRPHKQDDPTMGA